MTAPLLIIAAGGTGGHMFPAQALAETMLARGWRVKLSTDDRGARYAGGFPEVVTREIVPAATFARGGAMAKLAVGPKLALGVARAAASMRRDRPALVAGFGGYPAIPALTAAGLLRLPRLIHEQNGVLGRVNAVFARRVEAVACGTWPTKLPKGVEGIHTGNPVRAAIARRQGAGYIPPGDYPMKLLVLGGSQGANILSRVVPRAVAQLPASLRANLRVDHQARAEDYDYALDLYDEADIRGVTVETFFEDVDDRIAEAQLVVCRAGASTIADLTTIGRPAILVPLAIAAGDHQTANARALVDAGGAIRIPESQFHPDTLREQLETVLTHSQGAAMMAQAALSAGVPDAAARLADLVETHAKVT